VFKESGIWPPSAKARIKKIRSYKKRKRTINKVDANNSDLLRLPPTRPKEV
jgi:hypothetical protein